MKRTRNPKTKSLPSKAAPKGNGHRTNGKRSKFQMEEDISFVAQYLGKGLSVPQIHKLHKEWRKEYKLTERTIFNDANEALDRWRKLSHEAIDIEKGRHLLKLENIERTAWEKLEADRGEVTVTEAKEEMVGGSVQVSKKIRKQIQSTSPVDWMRVVQWALEQRAKILGLYAPLQMDGGGDIVLGDKVENNTPTVNIQINSTKGMEELTDFPVVDVNPEKLQG